MCFYNDDYEWIASVNEISHETSARRRRCGECGDMIPAGIAYLHVHQQEYEECCCGDELSDDYDPFHHCVIDPCQFGETFSFDMCHLCEKLRRAVHAREEQEGCPPGSREPAYGTLLESLWEHNDRDAYVAHALTMFPELSGSVIVQSLTSATKDV